MSQFSLDDYMLVRNKKQDLYKKYQQFNSNKAELSNCLGLFDSTECLKLDKLEIELVIHNLSLFVYDKTLFYELISSLNNSALDDLDGFVALKNQLNSFEFVLLSVYFVDDFRIKEKDYELIKQCLENELIITKLCQYDLNVNKLKIVYRGLDKENLLRLSFDCFLIKVYIQFVIDFLNQNKDIKFKPTQIVNFTSNTINWSNQDLIEHLKALNTTSSINENNEWNESDEILTNQQWSCVKCTFLNDYDLNNCALCNNPKDFDVRTIFYL